jgi:hypothetical protein
MPAWQKRQPSVQPRAISTETRSNTVSVLATGPSAGKAYLLMFGRNARWMGSGSSGSLGRATYKRPLSLSRSTSYSEGT